MDPSSLATVSMVKIYSKPTERSKNYNIGINLHLLPSTQMTQHTAQTQQKTNKILKKKKFHLLKPLKHKAQATPPQQSE